MEGTKVELEDMLGCRERRANLQRELLQTYHCALVSYCMNIPGPVKTNRQIRGAFDRGEAALLASLAEAGATRENGKILAYHAFHEPTGDEVMMAVDLPAEEIKNRTLAIEESDPLGRLFDMDVIGPDGVKLSRKAYRKCLICGRQAQECARARRHTVAEMQDAIDRLLAAQGL
jgi:holo-ACP synthase